MKEFLKTKTVTYNLMSFTGFRTLIIFSLLLESPKSYQEIADYFRKHPFLKKDSISLDTLRVYINSLKMSGCEITKTKRCEGSKYVMHSHPFQLDICDEQIKSIRKVYRAVIKTMEITEIIALDNFFTNIAETLKNKTLLERFNEFSVLSGINKDILKELLNVCRKKEVVVMEYNSPNSGINEVEVIADKVAFSNSKLYLYGTGMKYNQYVYYLISRIKRIKEIKLSPSAAKSQEIIKIGYEIKLPENEIHLNDNEKIIESSPEKTVIEITTSNPFPVKQRVLSLAGNCKVLYPKAFKDDVVETLKKMQEEYK